MVASSDSLQAYAVQQLFLAVQDDVSQVWLEFNVICNCVKTSVPQNFSISDSPVNMIKLFIF